MKVVVTGSAGFIGFQLARRLLLRGDIVSATTPSAHAASVTRHRARRRWMAAPIRSRRSRPPCGSPIRLMHLVEVLEKTLGRAAKRNYPPMQPGDVPETSSSADLRRLIDYAPTTPVEVGAPAFVDRCRDYYRV